MTRWLLLLMLASGAGAADLELFLLDEGVPAPGQIDVGEVPGGDFRDTRFRIRNTNAEAVILTRLRVLGQGFRLRNHPSIPFEIKSGENVDFRVRFQPPSFGSYSASLQVNDRVLLLFGRSPPSALLAVEEEGAFRTLVAGDRVSFGRVERKTSSSVGFRILNPAGSTVRVESLALGPGPYRMENAPALPLELPAESAVDFEIIYEPLSAGLHTVELLMDGRAFLLDGLGSDPPFPAPEILLSATTLPSGVNGEVVVRLTAPPTASGAGVLRMRFIPAIDDAGEDPAVVFLSSGNGEVALTFEEGETATLAGGETAAAFQTGTTAGTIELTATVGDHTVSASVTVPPAPVVMTSASAARIPTGIEVRVAGFDNAQSAERMTFQFFTKDGQPLPSGPTSANVGDAFQQYFRSTSLGGLFSLRATFPVAGDTSLLRSVEVSFANSVGASAKRRIDF